MGAPSLLVDTRLTCIDLPFARIRRSLSIVGQSFPIVGDLLALVCQDLSLVGELLTLIGDPFTLAVLGAPRAQRLLRTGDVLISYVAFHMASMHRLDGRIEPGWWDGVRSRRRWLLSSSAKGSSPQSPYRHTDP